MSLYEWLKNFLYQCFSRFYFLERSHVYEIDLEKGKEVFSAKIQIENGLATISEVDELASIRSVNKKKVLENLNKHDLCFIAKFNGKIISYSWYSTKVVDIGHGINFLVPDKAVYSYNSYTVPEYRRLGLNLAITSFADSYLSKEGYRFVYYLVNTDNVSNIKLSEKTGAIMLGILTVKKIFGNTSFEVSSESHENSMKIKKYFNLKE